MLVIRAFERNTLVVAGAVLFAALQGCQQGSPSGYQVPLPTETTPRICPGEVRSVSATYPVPSQGTLALASVFIQQGRNPASVSITWNAQNGFAPANATDLIVRDSRDTTRVLLTAPRLTSPGPTFLFAGTVTALNGTVDADEFYSTLQSGSAEMVFLAAPSLKTQGRAALVGGAPADWVNRTC